MGGYWTKSNLGIMRMWQIEGCFCLGFSWSWTWRPRSKDLWEMGRGVGDETLNMEMAGWRTFQRGKQICHAKKSARSSWGTRSHRGCAGENLQVVRSEFQKCKLDRKRGVHSLRQEDSPGGGHGNPLQYSCLENPMDRRAQRGLWFMGLQRVGHDWSNSACTSI